MPVMFRLTRPKQIQIGAVQDQDIVHSREVCSNSRNLSSFSLNFAEIQTNYVRGKGLD
jgi:hypothetical protein